MITSRSMCFRAVHNFGATFFSIEGFNKENAYSAPW